MFLFKRPVVSSDVKAMIAVGLFMAALIFYHVFLFWWIGTAKVEKMILEYRRVCGPGTTCQ